MSSPATPALNIPASSTSISIKIIDVATIAKLPANSLYQPPISGIEYLAPAPSFSFLLEHPSGQKLLFDLSIPKDVESLGQEVVERLKQVGFEVIVKQNVAEVLEENGIKREEINAVVWSHSHWDHKGDMSTFPSGTDLVVGPGSKKTFMGDGKGNSRLGGIEGRDVAGRNVREIDFQGPGCLKIGQFQAFDYFNDGSLYLLDTPGHSIGHLCALVRTTTSPDTFIFLGGDAAHHCAEIRPSTYVPMPSSITPNPISSQDRNVPFCPGSWFEDLNITRGRDPKGPLYHPKWAADMEETLRTIGKVQEYDGDETVFVILAHDVTMRCAEVPVFPKSINDWKKRGLWNDLKWAWIGDIKSSLMAKI